MSCSSPCQISSASHPPSGPVPRSDKLNMIVPLGRDVVLRLYEPFSNIHEVVQCGKRCSIVRLVVVPIVDSHVVGYERGVV
eukprot:9615253-Heterocapsa_arctica.AAC.1